MKNEQPRPFLLIQILSVLAFAVAGLPAGYGQASAQTAPDKPAVSKDETVYLPKFSVSERHVDPYAASEASSVARTATKIIDTPASIYVVSPGLIKDINPETMFDIVNYFPGVSPDRATGASGFGDRMVFRGIESFGSTVDNFSMIDLTFGIQKANFVPTFLDRAELLMGPNAIISPTGTPGGTMNISTKSPQFTKSTEISGTIGGYNASIFSFDTTGPLGDGRHLAYRVILHYQDSKLFIPGKMKIQAATAQFAYRFSDQANLVVKYFGVQQAQTGGQTAIDGQMVWAPNTIGGMTLSTKSQPGMTYDGWNGNNPKNIRTYRTNMVEAELTAALAERVNMRLAAFWYGEMTTGFIEFPSPVIGETWDVNTGQVNAVTGGFNPASVPIVANLLHTKTNQIQVQNDIAGNFDVGGISLKPVAGWAFTGCDMPYDYQLNYRGLPNADITTNIPYNQPQPSNPTFNSLGLNTPQDGFTFELYVHLVASFMHDRLLLSGGASRTWADINDYVYPYINTGPAGNGTWSGLMAGNPAGAVQHKTFNDTFNPLFPTVKPRHDNHDGGILFKVQPNVSVYYNFSTNSAIVQNNPWWQAGRQHEYGVKGQFFDGRLSTSIAHFAISQSNVPSTNPLFNTGQSTVQTLFANLTSKGTEFSLIGGVTKDLSVIMSYTQMKLRDLVGRRQRSIPDQLFNVLLNYRFNDSTFKGLNIFAGAIRQGDMAGETVNGYTTTGVPQQPGYLVPAFTIINVGAGYEFGRYGFHLNVSNVADTHAWWMAQARSSLAPYPGRNITLTVKVKL